MSSGCSRRSTMSGSCGSTRATSCAIRWSGGSSPPTTASPASATPDLRSEPHAGDGARDARARARAGAAAGGDRGARNERLAELRPRCGDARAEPQTSRQGRADRRAQLSDLRAGRVRPQRLHATAPAHRRGSRAHARRHRRQRRHGAAPGRRVRRVARARSAAAADPRAAPPGRPRPHGTRRARPHGGGGTAFGGLGRHAVALSRIGGAMIHSIAAALLALATIGAAPLAAPPAAPAGLAARAHWAVQGADEETQRAIDRGVMMLYAFDTGEARVAFGEALKKNADARLAYWGLAEADTIDINQPQSDAGDRRGAVAVADGRAHLAHASEVERMLVDAIAKRYGAGSKKDRFTRYAAALSAWTAAHRDDANVLTVAAFAIWNTEDTFFDGHDALLPKTKEMLADLDDALQLEPTNLGAHHLRIHLLEELRRSHEAIPNADALGSYVYPLGTSHLPHMAGHIWARVGEYGRMVDDNEHALSNDAGWFALGDGPGQQYMRNYHDHDVDFVIYGLTTVGRDDEAHAVAKGEDSGLAGQDRAAAARGRTRRRARQGRDHRLHRVRRGDRRRAPRRGRNRAGRAGADRRRGSLGPARRADRRRDRTGYARRRGAGRRLRPRVRPDEERAPGRSEELLPDADRRGVRRRAPGREPGRRSGGDLPRRAQALSERSAPRMGSRRGVARAGQRRYRRAHRVQSALEGQSRSHPRRARLSRHSDRVRPQRHSATRSPDSVPRGIRSGTCGSTWGSPSPS